MSDSVTIYHNPRCSKSRQTLDLIRSKGIEPTIIRYLETPPSEAELAILVKKLGLAPRALLRKGESEYRTLNLKDTSLDDQTIINAMATHPKLIERPIVVAGDMAILGRPPENVLEIL